MKTLILIFLLSAAVTAQTMNGFTARVIRAIDGDSLEVEHLGDGNVDRVRILGIDAPETAHSPREIPQPFGNKCREVMATITEGKTVFIETTRRDNFGRNLARVIVGQVDAGLFMLDAGCAWQFYPNGIDIRYRQNYLDAFNGARERKDGLFASSRPVTPSVWRKKKHLRRSKSGKSWKQLKRKTNETKNTAAKKFDTENVHDRRNQTLFCPTP